MEDNASPYFKTYNLHFYILLHGSVVLLMVICFEMGTPPANSFVK